MRFLLLLTSVIPCLCRSYNPNGRQFYEASSTLDWYNSGIFDNQGVPPPGSANQGAFGPSVYRGPDAPLPGSAGLMEIYRRNDDRFKFRVYSSIGNSGLDDSWNHLGNRDHGYNPLQFDNDYYNQKDPHEGPSSDLEQRRYFQNEQLQQYYAKQGTNPIYSDNENNNNENGILGRVWDFIQSDYLKSDTLDQTVKHILDSASLGK